MSAGHIDIVDNVVNKMMSSTRQITRGFYRVYKKNVLNTKLLLNWVFGKLQISTATNG